MVPITRIFSTFECINLSKSIVGKASVSLGLGSSLEAFNVERMFQEFTQSEADSVKHIRGSKLFKFSLKIYSLLTNFIKLYFVILKEGFFYNKNAIDIEDLIILSKSHSLFFRKINRFEKIKNNEQLKVRVPREIAKIEKLIKTVLEKVEIALLKHSSLSKSLTEVFFNLKSVLNENKTKQLINILTKNKLKNSICSALGKDLKRISRFRKGVKSILYYSVSFPFDLHFQQQLPVLLGAPTHKPRKLTVSKLGHKVDRAFFKNYIQHIRKKKKRKQRTWAKRKGRPSGFVLESCVRKISSSIRPTIKFFKRFKLKNDFFLFSLDKLSSRNQNTVKSRSLFIKSFFLRFKQLKIVSTLAYLLQE
jgi:hypothetical protein